MKNVGNENSGQKELERLLADIGKLEQIFANWDESGRNAVEAYRRAVETLHGEALARLIRALKTDPAALPALKEAAHDEVVYAVLRHHNLLKPSLTERIETALEGVRPMLAAHGGDVALVNVDPPRAEVQFRGACDGCAASTITLQAGVKKAIRDACPEITEIVPVTGSGRADGVRFVSPFAGGAKGSWEPACRLTDIPEGSLRALDVGGQNLLMFRKGAAVTCFQNACAHLGMPIDEGTVEDGKLICPHHGFCYDLATGECLTAPEVQLQAYPVRVIGDRVEVSVSA